MILLSMKPIYTKSTISSFLKSLNDQTVVFTNGCFDVLHPGHLTLLSHAKSFGDALIVGLNSDASVRRLKGKRRPINDEQFRATMLLGLKSVDAVIIFEDDTPIESIRIIQPNVHVKGGDYIAEELPEYQVVIDGNGRIEIVDLVDGFSSSAIIDRLNR